MKTLLKYPQGKKDFYFEINTNVGDYAFEYARNLVCVKFGKGCKSIGKTAFYDVRQYLHACRLLREEVGSQDELL